MRRSVLDDVLHVFNGVPLVLDGVPHVVFSGVPHVPDRCSTFSTICSRWRSPNRAGQLPAKQAQSKLL
jgi:hypothetical protein